MSDTSSDVSGTHGVEESHGESHTSISGRKSRRKSHVDALDASPQVRKSRGAEEKVTRPLPRKVTFSGLPLGRPERDTERGEINKNPGPEPVGPIAEKVLDRLAAQPADEDLTARRREALDRLRRAHTTNPLTRRKQP